MPVDAVAWYGTIRSVEPTVAGADYLKLWHLDIWPKFGRAVGVTGADPAIDAEIERLRDKDIKATFWGNLTCGVADYGGCQLVVTRLSADDGGPTFPPERIEAWEGTVERLPAQPGGQNSLHDFILAGEVPVLYGITGADPAVQADLERLPETGTTVRIWGELRSKARPVTGTLIDVDRIEVVD